MSVHVIVQTTVRTKFVALTGSTILIIRSSITTMNNDLGKDGFESGCCCSFTRCNGKMSLCVQRIQEGKLTAKKEGRELKDGEVNTACAQTCPTNAITFGDYNICRKVQLIKCGSRKNAVITY